MKKAFILILLTGFWCSAFAQIDVKSKVKRQAHDRADRMTDEGIDAGFDVVEDGIKSIFRKKERSEREDNAEEEEYIEEEVEEPEYEEEEESFKPVAKPVKSIPDQPSFASYTKYDFVPGDQVILYEDFSQDAIGDFPGLWTTDGSGEVRATNLYPGNWFFMNAQDRVYNLMKNLNLPQNYILEFDVVPTSQEEGYESSSFSMALYNSEDEEFLNSDLFPGKEGIHFHIYNESWEMRGYNDQEYSVDGGSQLAPVQTNKLNHVIVWVQNRRVRVYHKGQKVMDMPTILPANTKLNRLRYSLWSMNGFPYISNIRITSAAPDMRSKLLTEGKIVSYGMYFDVNSDQVKPESYGSLKQIADVMNENPEVSIKIVGHTDADGNDAANMDLSKRRAASVKNELVKTFSIPANRIETDGMGESQPLQNNNTTEGKAKNRRVEFIKL